MLKVEYVQSCFWRIIRFILVCAGRYRCFAGSDYYLSDHPIEGREKADVSGCLLDGLGVANSKPDG